MSEVSNITPVAEVLPVVVSGLSVSERKLSVAYLDMSASEARFLASHSSNRKVVQAVSERLRDADYKNMVKACATGNYRSLALWLASETGSSFTLNRAFFEALPYYWDRDIEKCHLSKSGGMTTNKDGVQVPNATLRRLMTLKAVCTEVVRDAAETAAKNRAEAEAKAAQLELHVAGL